METPKKTYIVTTGDYPSNPPNEYEDAFRTVFEELYDLICKKQAAYGTGNIESFGEVGLLVRLSDKLERLKNLMTTGQNPDWESIEDTWMDIANYGVIGLCVARGLVFHPPVKYGLTKKER